MRRSRNHQVIRHQESCAEAGFTLVEVLVVLVLVSLLTAALFAGIRLGVNIWQRVASRSADFDQSLAVQDFLGRTIGRAYPLFVKDSLTHGHVEFFGSKTSMRFVARTPMARGLGGYSRYVLSSEPRGERRALILTAEPVSSTETGSLSKNVLLTRLSGIEFSYFGSERSGPASWQDHWTADAKLPDLVRIRIRYQDGEDRRWPDLVIAPRIDADVNCFYDSLTKSCRGR